MKRHVSLVHEGNKPFQCEICAYRFSQKGHMRRHIASVHEEKKPLKCDICDHSTVVQPTNRVGTLGYDLV